MKFLSLDRLVDELLNSREVKCPRPRKEWKRFPNKCQIPRAAEKLFFVSNLPLKGSQQKEGNIYLSCPASPCKRCHVIFQAMRMRPLISWINPTSEKLRKKIAGQFQHADIETWLIISTFSNKRFNTSDCRAISTRWHRELYNYFNIQPKNIQYVYFILWCIVYYR